MNFFISIFSLDLCGLLVFVLASILSTAKGFDLELISTIPRHNFVGVNLPVTGAALDVAQTTINARFFPYLNLSVTLLYNKSDSMCDTPTVVGSDPNAPVLLADYYNTQAANRCVAIIVSGCGGMTSIPYLAKEWNVLQFSNSMVPSFVYNHMTTPTSIGMAGSMDDAGTALLDLLLYFKWFHATFIMEFTSSTATTLYDLFYFTANALLRRYPKYRLLQLEKTQYNLQDEQSQKIALQLASARSRVFLMLSSTPVVIRLMRLMRDLGLFQPGSHVFIVLQPTEQVSYGPASLFAFPKEEDKNLFRSVLYLTSFTPAGDESVALNDVLANRSQVLYGTTLEDGFKPLDLAPVQATFNSAYIFATLVNDSKNAEGAGRLNDAQLCNGRRLRSLMVNRTFAFPGGPVYIDPLGYSHVGFVVLASNHERGNYQIVGRYDSFQQIYIWDPQTRLEWVGTGPPADVPLCGFSGREGICKDQERSMAVTIGAAIVGALAAILLICTVLLIRRAQVQNRQTRPWVLSAAEFKLSGTQQLDETYLSAEIDGRCAFRGRDVWISTVGISPKTHILDHRMVTLGDLLFACHQNNVNQFLGLIIHPANSSLLFVEEFGGKGSLRDLINNGSINREFQKSFVQDLIQGLHFIHTSKFRKHGRLTSLCCIIDSHFVLKISKLGHEHLRDLDGSTVAHNRNPVSPEFSIWSPPALSQSAGRVTDSKADIYALGIILYELFTSLDVSEIAYHLSEKLATQRFCSPLVPDDLLGWIVRCSSEDPFQRPSIEQVLKVLFAKLQIRKQDNLMSRTMRRLETYANDLEDKVNERTKDLLEQRRLCDSLLEEMLPRVIVERLRAHEDVTPRMFDSVTVYFSDIDGFGDYALANTPYDVISFLNQVYSTLDVLISQFDVYKVETINDSYVVVSGIPIPNGSHHASAVAFMALSFLRAYSESNFRRQTRLRVGMHSGPVAAGVVGHRSPRYCLFGDTMNTASRMESHGEPGRIHVSPKTAEFLKEVPQLQLTPRGTVTIIGKGQMETFWLEASQPLEPFC